MSIRSSVIIFLLLSSSLTVPASAQMPVGASSDTTAVPNVQNHREADKLHKDLARPQVGSKSPLSYFKDPNRVQFQGILGVPAGTKEY